MNEAKGQYALAAEAGGDQGDPGALLGLYEKMIGLDRADLETRLKMARLLVKTGSIDRATAELNETAELLLARAKCPSRAHPPGSPQDQGRRRPDPGQPGPRPGEGSPAATRPSP